MHNHRRSATAAASTRFKTTSMATSHAHAYIYTGAAMVAKRETRCSAHVAARDRASRRNRRFLPHFIFLLILMCNGPFLTDWDILGYK